MNHGLTVGVSDQQYHADRTSLSSSGARKVLACPARFAWERDHQAAPKQVFDLGKVAHAVILGEGSPVTVVEADNWMGKAAKEQRAAAYVDGSTPILAADYESVLAMKAAVLAHPLAAVLFADGLPELSGWWRDEPTDVGLRFRPDWLTTLDGRPVCVDLKTTVNADPDEFGRSVVKFGYHQQAAWYLAGLAAHAVDDARFLFVCVEKSAPHLVSVIELDAEAFTEGACLNRQAIDLFAECTATGIWPAYGTGIHTIGLPAWATRNALRADANNLIAQLEGLTA